MTFLLPCEIAERLVLIGSLQLVVVVLVAVVLGSAQVLVVVDIILMLFLSLQYSGSSVDEVVLVLVDVVV